MSYTYRRSKIHVVLGYLNGEKPVGDTPIQGFGASDKQALEQAKQKALEVTNGPVVFYYVRYDGKREPVGTPLSTVSPAKLRNLRRWQR